MGIAKDILDGIVTKLGTAGLTDVDIERQLVPQEYKSRLSQRKIVVAWNGKESNELDRSNESLLYKVALGIYYPVTGVQDSAKQDLVINFMEEVQDFLAAKANREITLTSGSARLILPFSTDQIYDPAEVKQTGNFFSVMNYNYRYFKGRS